MMPQRQIWYTVLITFILISALVAQEIPPGGESALPPDAAIKMSLQGGSNARRKIVDVTEMPFEKAVEVETITMPENTWGIQLSIETLTSIKKNDVFLAIFYAKGIQSSRETGEVFSELIFETNASPWTKSVSYPIIVIGEWKMFLVPFISAMDYAPRGATVKFRLGYNPQIIQIGGLELLNYKDKVNIDDLPRTKITYEGMDPNAPWRAEAAQLIDTHRKDNIEITVTDENGTPINAATVHVKMQRHAYKFGSAVDATYIMGTSADNDKYNEIIETYFNRVVMENDLKWPVWEIESRRNTTLDALDYLCDLDIEIRGHTLVWPSWQHLPDDLEANKNDPTYLRNRVKNHIEEEVSQVAGMIVNWDVINEPYWNHDLMDILGDEVMVEWFQIAYTNDPAAKPYLNDNNIISGGGLDEKHQEHFYYTVQYLLDNGAPLQGLGTQCHFGENVTPPRRIWEILDKLATYGLEIQATEFDIATNDKELQANYTRDFMTAYFAHPATVGILMWGFWAGKHWRPEAALWDREWNLRPHGEVWVELVTQTWWTDETLTTDASGTATVRAFLGDYIVDLQYPGKLLQTKLSHARGGTKIIVKGNSINIEHGQPSNVENKRTSVPLTPQLNQNYPNPFNPETTIHYCLVRPGRVRLQIFNAQGQLIQTLLDREQPSGEFTVKWEATNSDGQPVSSGLYFCLLKGDDFQQVRKMVVIR